MVSWPVMYKSDYENGCLKILKKKQPWILIKKWAKDRKKKNSQIE